MGSYIIIFSILSLLLFGPVVGYWFFQVRNLPKERPFTDTRSDFGVLILQIAVLLLSVLGLLIGLPLIGFFIFATLLGGSLAGATSVAAGGLFILMMIPILFILISAGLIVFIIVVNWLDTLLHLSERSPVHTNRIVFFILLSVTIPAFALLILITGMLAGTP